ncbi:MAG: membrane protein insertase YidC, partial [Synergistales bacterium]|nr:membrane protein insertase YidC [Synergistales bacterium]
MLVVVLEYFYNFTGSYGIAIILLTLIVRILLHPLSHKQMVGMQKMQKLQPRIKTLQEKYKDDKETLNREIMSLYKENKVNPAAGCLPLLVQLPILILL